MTVRIVPYHFWEQEGQPVRVNLQSVFSEMSTHASISNTYSASYIDSDGNGGQITDAGATFASSIGKTFQIAVKLTSSGTVDYGVVSLPAASFGKFDASLTVKASIPSVGDLKATSLEYDQGSHDALFTYEVGDLLGLPLSTTVGLYWSADDRFDPLVDTQVGYSFDMDPSAGLHGPLRVSNPARYPAPDDAMFLLLVVDPPSPSNPKGRIVERNENNNVLALRAKFETAVDMGSTHVPSVYGQEVSIETIVTGFPHRKNLPTGTITIYDGSADNILIAVQIATGAVGFALDTTTLTAGTHRLQAVYSGDDGFWANESLVLPQVVNKAVLLVTADDKDIDHGDPKPFLTYQATGFANGENESVLKGRPFLDTDADEMSPARLYPIEIQRGTLSADNYTFRFVDGTVSVHPKVVDVVVHYGSQSMSIMNLTRNLPFINITSIDIHLYFPREHYGHAARLISHSAAA